MSTSYAENNLSADGCRWRVWVPLLAGSAAISVLLVVLAIHSSPCNPRNLGKCAEHLDGVLRTLDARDARDAGLHHAGDEDDDISAICPPAQDALDCYYWFSRRCLGPGRGVPHQRFYAHLYMEASRALVALCYPNPSEEPSLLQTQAACLKEVRWRRGRCSQSFHLELQRHEDPHSASISLYDDDGLGKYRMPFCKALRLYLLCVLELVRDYCGVPTVERVQTLQDNVTNILFNHKCPANLKPTLLEPSALPLFFVKWTIIILLLVALLTGFIRQIYSKLAESGACSF